MKKRRVKKRIKTNVYIIAMFILFELLPVVDVLNNKIITFIYFILGLILIIILHNRIIKEN